MANFYRNNVPLFNTNLVSVTSVPNGIIQCYTNSNDLYKNNGITIASNTGYTSITNIDQSANTINYKINDVDISRWCIASYIEGNTILSQTMPSWCKKIRVILIGGGGAYTAESHNNQNQVNVNLQIQHHEDERNSYNDGAALQQNQNNKVNQQDQTTQVNYIEPNYQLQPNYQEHIGNGNNQDQGFRHDHANWHHVGTFTIQNTNHQNQNILPINGGGGGGVYISSLDVVTYTSISIQCQSGNTKLILSEQTTAQQTQTTITANPGSTSTGGTVQISSNLTIQSSSSSITNTAVQGVFYTGGSTSQSKNGLELNSRVFPTIVGNGGTLSGNSGTNEYYRIYYLTD
jgi:hypothetical protein